MTNSADILRARIEFNKARLEAINGRETEFKNKLTNAKVVNGTSPATTRAVREVFAETVANSDIKPMVQAMLTKTKKRQITREMFARIIENRKKDKTVRRQALPEALSIENY